MANSLATPGAQLMLNWVVGKIVTQPINLEIRLMSANGSMNTPGTEITGSAYTPKPVTFGPTSDIGSGVLQAVSNVAVNWASLDASSNKTIAGVELWDDTNNVRLAWSGFAGPVTVNAGQPFNNPIGEFTVTWLTSGTDGLSGFDKAIRIKMLDWLLAKSTPQPVPPFTLFPCNADGDFDTNATLHPGNLWSAQDIEFDLAEYLSNKVFVANSQQLEFSGLDSATAMDVDAFEIWDNSGPDQRIAYLTTANHPVATPPVIPAGDAFQVAVGAIKLKVV